MFQNGFFSHSANAKNYMKEKHGNDYFDALFPY